MRCAHCHKPISRAAATVTTTSRACAGMTFTTVEDYGPKCAMKLGLTKGGGQIVTSLKTKQSAMFFLKKQMVYVQDGQESLFEDVAA